MAREVNLRDYCDVTLCCILYNLAALILCVEEWAVVLAVVVTAVLADDSLITLCRDCCELRVLLDLDTPALVIGEVPVEAVEVVERKHVDEALD